MATQVKTKDKINNLKSRIFGKLQLNQNRIRVDEFIRRDQKSLPLTRMEYEMLCAMQQGKSIPYRPSVNEKRMNRIAFYCGIRNVLSYNYDTRVWNCLSIDEDFMITNSYKKYFPENVVDVIKSAVELEYVYKAKISKFSDDTLIKKFEEKNPIVSPKQNEKVAKVKTALKDMGKSLQEQIEINKDIHNVITNYETLILNMNKMDIICDDMKSLINKKFNENVKNYDVVDYVLRKKTDIKIGNTT